MSAFLKSLIDIGENQDESQSSVVADNTDLLSLTKEQLIDVVKKMELKQHEKRVEFEKYRSECSSLRSEYDAYKLKVEKWQKQMKEAREADKQTVAELRKAGGGSAGGDDAYTKTLLESIDKYKEELRAANEEISKAYQKQREAEEARRSFEERKNAELTDMGSNFDAFKERMKKNQEKYEKTISELKQQCQSQDDLSMREDIAALKSEVEEAVERARKSDERCTELEVEVETAKEELQKRRAAGIASRGSRDRVDNVDASGNADSDAADAEEQHASGQSEDLEAAFDELRSVKEDYEKAKREAAQLRKELSAVQSKLEKSKESAESVAQRRKQLEAELAQANTTLEDEREKWEQKQEDMQWDVLEAQRKVSEAVAALDAVKSQSSDLEMKLANAKKEVADAQSAVDDVARQKDEEHAKFVEDMELEKTGLEEQLAAVQRDLDNANAKTQEQSSALGEAQKEKLRGVEEVERQRQNLERRVLQLESSIRDGEAHRGALESALREAREDLSAKDDVIDEIRTELIIAEQRQAEAEMQLTVIQQTISTREDEVVTKERERQQMRSQLSAESEQIIQLRQSLKEEREAGVVLGRELQDVKLAMEGLEMDLKASKADVDFGKRELSTAKATMARRENEVDELKRRLEDLGSVTADYQRLREDQSAKIRQYEGKLRNMEELQAQQVVPQADTSQGLSQQSAVGRKVVDNRAMFGGNRGSFNSLARSLGLSWKQLRLFIAIVAALLLLLGMWSAWSTVTPSTNKEFETMTRLEVMKEQFDSSVRQLVKCREELKRCSGGKDGPGISANATMAL